MTITALAAQAEISKQAVSAYESPSTPKAPSIETIQRLSDALEFPVGYFLERTDGVTANSSYFRSNSSALKKHQRVAIRKAELTAEIARILREHLYFPDVSIPDFPISSSKTIEDASDEIESLAENLREILELKQRPIPDTIKLLEGLGAIVTTSREIDPAVDAFSMWASDGNPYVIVAKGTYSRRRLSIAHELFHLIAHRSERLEDGQRDKLSHKNMEAQANYFAGALLLPRKSFEIELAQLPAITLDTLLSLKERWGASVAAMIVRSHHVGAISEREKTLLFQRLSKRGWRRLEPLDTQAHEEPTIFKTCVELLRQEGLSNSSIRQLFPFHQNQLEGLLGLAHGSLADTERPFVAVRKSPKN